MKPIGDIDVIKAMLSKAREKLKTAQIDFNNERYDDAISRTYYAVFHAISAALLSKGLHFSSHGQTIGAFNREFIKTKKFPSSFSKTIKKLFRERQMGDYDVQSSKVYKVSRDYWKK